MKSWLTNILMFITLGSFLMGTAGFTYHTHTCISSQHTDIHVVQFADEHNHDYTCCSHDQHNHNHAEEEQGTTGTSFQCCTDSYSQMNVDDTFLDTGKKLSNRLIAHNLLFPFQLSLNIKLSGQYISYRYTDSGPPFIPDNYIYQLSSLLL